MSVVVINAITVGDGAGPELEKRFAARAGAVDQQPGFVSFRLLRPTGESKTYYVETTWESQEAFEAWMSSAAFSHGHRGEGAGEQPRPVSTSNEVLTFEVVDLGAE